ncbi:two component transcriptional regulator, LuxR family [Mariniradius saccharolyticus AK6]|uniref:Two component transcriptional regulator, LuxR family n=1 Tax=Mariniradius saccharolyticus AK6 TaxID=1239962 RepID=M7X7H9_9BACT|nr:response regulator transcription factor [Mariniradius saccharolyticus]EMS30929.1 two component transcriptional regulator, LuxR family [Mariniradius saccharolyticus AK6]
MSKKKLKLIHIDDHVLFVQGIYSLLQNEVNIQWAGSGENISDALSMIKTYKPEIVLLDYFLPDGNGIAAIKQILSARPKTIILMLTMENSAEVMEKCKAAGVMAFLPKSIDKKQLLDAIWNAAAGIGTFPQLESRQPAMDSDAEKIQSLSKREKEIGYLIAKGLSSVEISEKLFLSLLTVNTHRRNLRKKLNLSNTAQLTSLISKYSRKDLGLE